MMHRDSAVAVVHLVQGLLLVLLQALVLVLLLVLGMRTVGAFLKPTSRRQQTVKPTRR